jgi:AraC-like DNA-binding protein
MAIQNIIINRPNGLFLIRNNLNKERDWRYDNCYKFIYSYDGNMKYQTPAKDISISKSQFIIFNPFDEHKQIDIDKNKFLIELNSSFLNEVGSSVYEDHHFDIQFASVTQKHPLLIQWVNFVYNHVLNEHEEYDNSADIFLDHSFVQLALLLVRYTIGNQTKDLVIPSNGKANHVIYKTMDAFKDNYQHQWTLDEMAKVAHLNKYQFAHLFKEIAGISPYSWLQIYRIIRSQHLIIKTKKSILEIAVESGFSSLSVYNRLFKQLYGLTPVSFRKKYT